MNFIFLVIAFLVGGVFGMTVMALCVIAGKADERNEMKLRVQETKGKYIGNNEYEYLCENCGEIFTSNDKSLIGLDRLCDACFESYADQMYGYGMEESANSRKD